jgi:glycosyltransferase involved in cell wall biosynthesis
MEILVVDDGSTDDTEVRVRKYGSRLKYLHKSNGGQASALNLGFECMHVKALYQNRVKQLQHAKIEKSSLCSEFVFQT